MSEQTSLNCLDNFCLCVTDLYQKEYLRKPTAYDIERIYATHDTKHGFKGMLRSIDCSNNDINVLNRSPLFDSIKNGTAPPSPFTVNGHDYTHGYYLADGIYPDWATLIKVYSSPTDDPAAKFTWFQESARKDVERTYGVLQGRFNILRVPERAWKAKKISRILYACILLHNMIQEDNGFAITSLGKDYLRGNRGTREKEIHDKDVHSSIRADLNEHIWNLPPNFRHTI
ncbi:uncharacterized protein [Rutidosis leptorrhynchoides]|uniref:uncharacterized protein n=1 Tax=Rutidosis leptorrhynchoides TaxID=125765 RepID=UPI003A99151B